METQPNRPNDELVARRAERHRQADNSGRPDRIAELAADIEASVQRAKWSLSVEQAASLNTLLTEANWYDTGVDLSGDHRPRLLALYPRAM